MSKQYSGHLIDDLIETVEKSFVGSSADSDVLGGTDAPFSFPTYQYQVQQHPLDRPDESTAHAPERRIHPGNSLVQPVSGVSAADSSLSLAPVVAVLPTAGALAEQHARIVLEEFADDELDSCECCGRIGECASDCELSIQISRDDAESRWR